MHVIQDIDTLCLNFLIWNMSLGIRTLFNCGEAIHTKYTHKSKLVVGAWHRAPGYVGSWYYYAASPSLSQRGTVQEGHTASNCQLCPNPTLSLHTASSTPQRETRLPGPPSEVFSKRKSQGRNKAWEKFPSNSFCQVQRHQERKCQTWTS